MSKQKGVPIRKRKLSFIRRFIKSIEIWFRLRLLSILKLLFTPREIKEMISPEDIPNARVLFLRPDRIGDVIISTPAIKLIKKNYPSIHLDMLASKRNLRVIKRLPYIDDIVLYRKNPILFLWSLVKVFLRKYDIAIDLMDVPSVTSAVYLIASRASYRLGFARKPGGYNVNFIYNVYVPSLPKGKSHIIERTSQVVHPFGIPVTREDMRPDFPLGTEEMNYAKRIYASYRRRIDTPTTMVGVNISAGKITRWWGEENYASLVRGIIERGFTPILLYEPSWRNLALTIERLVNDKRFILGPALDDFSLYAAFVKGIDILITPDTSVVHLASAFKIPTVALFPEDYENYMNWRPFDIPSRVVRSPVMDELWHIRVEDVIRAFDELVKELRIETLGGSDNA